jgi:SAM-dependent methyltransferase
MQKRSTSHRHFTAWKEFAVAQSTRREVEAALRYQANKPLVIGRIDADGRVLGEFGRLGALPSVERAHFLERKRVGLDIVLLDGLVLVRKDFRGDWVGFLREWLGLAFLGGKANVPDIYLVDEDKCVLYKNLVLGQTVREILVRAGAKILDAQTIDDHELAAFPPAARVRAVAARGTAVVGSCLSGDFLLSMERQMNTFHAYGVTGVSNTFGNVVSETSSGEPWFIDLDRCETHPKSRGFIFALGRDKDRVQFNQLYGRKLLTEMSARAELSALISKCPNWYAPIDFGGGLTVGAFWSTDSGTGKWEFLNQHVVAPLVVGKRVLDLGSNNGVMPLMMLRAGAREIVGVEASASFVESSRLVHRIFEWRDMREYSFRVHHCDMLGILEGDWGVFDVVTAFCSLYYLDAPDMERVVRKVSELAPLMVIQANSSTRQEAACNKAEKSSVRFLEGLLRRNGFPEATVVAPKGYSRPLLIGRKTASGYGGMSPERSVALCQAVRR